jgi:ATP-dependent Clp protease ATP-binding subunit ClpC
MTSNVGARQLKDFGQGDKVNAITKCVENLAPEFLNRIDDVIVFNTLEKHDIDLIIEIELKIICSPN